MCTGPPLTFYHVELNNTILYSRQHQRVKKINSYAIAYHHHGVTKYAFIEYLHNRIIAVLIPFRALNVTCTNHFKLTIAALDSVLYILPVKVQNSIFSVCFVEQIVTKCLFLDLDSVQYVIHLLSMMFD